MRVAIMLIVIIVGATAGYYTGKKSARNRYASEITGAAKQNGIWKYFDFQGKTGRSAEFLLATQCISGGTQEQTLYFITETDSKGNNLESGNNYKVEGTNLPCGSWSIAAYADKDLIKSSSQNFLTQSMVKPVDGNKWEAYISSNEQSGNSLYSGAGGTKMTVVLRIYSPSPELLEGMGVIELPTITKI